MTNSNRKNVIQEVADTMLIDLYLAALNGLQKNQERLSYLVNQDIKILSKKSLYLKMQFIEFIQ